MDVNDREPTMRPKRILFILLVCAIFASPGYSQAPGSVRGMAVQDPADKQNVRGFVHVPTVWCEQLNPLSNSTSIGRVVIGLTESVNKYTGITAYPDDMVYLSANNLLEYPFLYITTYQAFQLTESERLNFEHYLRNGGFAVLESSQPVFELNQAEASLKQMLRDSLKEDARFLPIPISHPLYHSFFDFDDGPPQGREIGTFTTRFNDSAGIDTRFLIMSKTRPFLEGVFLDDRLVAVYSGKGYGMKWKDLSNNAPQQKMGVNFVVFALTQEGGIARKGEEEPAR
jgi:hypothetical protein